MTFLKNLKLNDNIAKNLALRENFFMMAVCVELRIPLFLVGKPGSSKSLSKTILDHNMQGRDSESELFKSFKQVCIVVCLFWVLRPTREILTHMEMSPVTVKGF